MNLVRYYKWHFFDADLMPERPVIVHAGLAFIDPIREIWQLYPKARMIALEPQSKNFRDMVTLAVEENIPVCLHRLALASDNGRFLLNVYESKQAHSLFPKHRFKKRYGEPREEMCFGITLAQLLDLVGEPINLLVMNCEGGELYAFEQLQDPAVRSVISQICVAFHGGKAYPVSIEKNLLTWARQYYTVIEGKWKKGEDMDYLFIKKGQYEGLQPIR